MKKIKNRFIVVLIGIFLMPMGAQGYYSKIEILRGGYGFLFPDHNSFANPGQFAIERGLAVQALYDKNNATGKSDATASFVYGGRGFGMGAFGTRNATNVLDPTTGVDSAGVGIGASTWKERITLGGGYTRNVSAGQTNNGVVSAQATMNGPKGLGPAIGIGASATLQDIVKNTQTATLALGYSYKRNTSIEASLVFNDYTNNMRDFSANVYFNWGGPVVYLATAYNFSNLNSSSQIQARLGANLGRFVDLSVFTAYPIAPASAPTFGGTFRMAF